VRDFGLLRRRGRRQRLKLFSLLECSGLTSRFLRADHPVPWLLLLDSFSSHSSWDFLRGLGTIGLILVPSPTCKVTARNHINQGLQGCTGLVLLFSWLHLRLHWRSLFTFTGAGEVIEEKYMAPIYNWYRDWWNPDLRAQRNARRGRRDQNLSSP